MTTADDVIQSFESTFADKTPLPDSLVFQWLIKAIARYSMEIDDLTFDVETKEWSDDLRYNGRIYASILPGALLLSCK